MYGWPGTTLSALFCLWSAETEGRCPLLPQCHAFLSAWLFLHGQLLEGGFLETASSLIPCNSWFILTDTGVFVSLPGNSGFLRHIIFPLCFSLSFFPSTCLLSNFSGIPRAGFWDASLAPVRLLSRRQSVQVPFTAAQQLCPSVSLAGASEHLQGWCRLTGLKQGAGRTWPRDDQ